VVPPLLNRGATKTGRVMAEAASSTMWHITVPQEGHDDEYVFYGPKNSARDIAAHYLAKARGYDTFALLGELLEHDDNGRRTADCAEVEQQAELVLVGLYTPLACVLC
jgi:hypothetical protein